MKVVKFSKVSIFLITFEIAVAAIALIPLSTVFCFFGLLILEHENGGDMEYTFYPKELEPFLKASLIIYSTIYGLQILQIITGVMMLYSFNLMETNLLGTMKTSWIFLSSSLVTCSILCYLLAKTVNDYDSNTVFILSIVSLLLQKIITFAFLFAFNISACLVLFNK